MSIVEPFILRLFSERPLSERPVSVRAKKGDPAYVPASRSPLLKLDCAESLLVDKMTVEIFESE